MLDIVASLELLRGAEHVIEQHSSSSKNSQKVLRLIKAVILKFERHGNTFLNKIQIPQYGGHNQGSHTNLSLIGTQSSREGNDWLWEWATPVPVDDPVWTYMKEFLDLPDENVTNDP